MARRSASTRSTPAGSCSSSGVPGEAAGSSCPCGSRSTSESSLRQSRPRPTRRRGRASALRAARSLLVPGGRLVFDVFTPSREDIEETDGRWLERAPRIEERADWDPDAPLTSAKLNALYDNTEYLAQWLGGSYRANAAPDHIHDGVGSALISIGANDLRNPSFETDTAGWTITQYTGGTVVRDAANPLDGQASLAFTSTVLANGGGDSVSNEYIPCSGGQAGAGRGS